MYKTDSFSFTPLLKTLAFSFHFQGKQKTSKTILIALRIGVRLFMP